ncbi:hypothetical protein HYH03_007101 [Edaphochlamys debaryana]|uniref:Uncharacterized protein n=1 Tax=Edaphochlamys debaryana TaxID=47281 RepID=A0A836BZJ6_9CHLO|nr:hypothetical protein HYH03_007101 [Edaphochlamys debaryana]|eukprot:KAG2494861.1 hypothetical protein HYH03_007101 [Edaphochlamys debaryana]
MLMSCSVLAALLNPLVIQEGAECPRWISNPHACTQPERCGLYQKCKRCSALAYAENLAGWLLLQPNGDLQLYTVRPSYINDEAETGWGRIVLTWSTKTNQTKASKFGFVLLKDGTWELWGGSKDVPYGVRATSAGSFFGMEGGSPNSHTYPENAGEANAPFKLRVFDFGVHRWYWSYAAIENKHGLPAWSTLDVNPCTNQAVCPGDPLALCRPTADWTGQDCTACKPPYFKDANGKCVGHNLAFGSPTSIHDMSPQQSTSPSAAVDGNTATSFVGLAWYVYPQPAAYWQVDLGPTNIAHVEVIGSFNFNTLYVDVGSAQYTPPNDWSNPTPSFERRVLDLDPPVLASYIRVHAQTPFSYYPTPMQLSLAERLLATAAGRGGVGVAALAATAVPALAPSTGPREEEPRLLSGLSTSSQAGPAPAPFLPRNGLHASYQGRLPRGLRPPRNPSGGPHLPRHPWVWAPPGQGIRPLSASAALASSGAGLSEPFPAEGSTGGAPTAQGAAASASPTRAGGGLAATQPQEAGGTEEGSPAGAGVLGSSDLVQSGALDEAASSAAPQSAKPSMGRTKQPQPRPAAEALLRSWGVPSPAPPELTGQFQAADRLYPPQRSPEDFLRNATVRALLRMESALDAEAQRRCATVGSFGIYLHFVWSEQRCHPQEPCPLAEGWSGPLLANQPAFLVESGRNALVRLRPDWAAERPHRPRLRPKPKPSSEAERLLRAWGVPSPPPPDLASKLEAVDHCLPPERSPIEFVKNAKVKALLRMEALPLEQQEKFTRASALGNHLRFAWREQEYHPRSPSPFADIQMGRPTPLLDRADGVFPPDRSPADFVRNRVLRVLLRLQELEPAERQLRYQRAGALGPYLRLAWAERQLLHPEQAKLPSPWWRLAASDPAFTIVPSTVKHGSPSVLLGRKWAQALSRARAGESKAAPQAVDAPPPHATRPDPVNLTKVAADPPEAEAAVVAAGETPVAAGVAAEGWSSGEAAEASAGRGAPQPNLTDVWAGAKAQAGLEARAQAGPRPGAQAGAQLGASAVVQAGGEAEKEAGADARADQQEALEALRAAVTDLEAASKRLEAAAARALAELSRLEQQLGSGGEGRAAAVPRGTEAAAALAEAVAEAEAVRALAAGALDTARGPQVEGRGPRGVEARSPTDLSLA